jgi:hypothetical protein
MTRVHATLQAPPEARVADAAVEQHPEPGPATSAEPLRDLDIRLALKQRLMACHADDPDLRLFDELELCLHEARVDLAVINGQLEGFEIKSDRDTLSRLDRQAEVYGRVFDRMTVVAGRRHLNAVLECAPAWWEVVEAVRDRGGEVVLQRKRRGRANPGRDPGAIASLLWRAEALAVLERHALAGGLRSRPCAQLWEALAMGVPLHTLRAEVRAALCAREGWRAEKGPSSGDDTSRRPARSSGSRFRRLPPHKRR